MYIDIHHSSDTDEMAVINQPEPLALKIDAELIHLTRADVDIPVCCCCRRYAASRHKSHDTITEDSFIPLRE